MRQSKVKVKCDYPKCNKGENGKPKEWMKPYAWCKRIKNNFCDQDCHGKYQSEHMREEKAAGWKGGGIKKICEYCGDQFVTNQAYPDKECCCQRHADVLEVSNNYQKYMPLIKKYYIEEKKYMHEVVRLIGSNVKSIRKYMDMAGISRRGYGVIPKLAQDKEKVIKAYLDKKTFEEIAEDYDMGSEAVYVQLKKWGIKMRSPGERVITKREGYINPRKTILPEKEIIKLYIKDRKTADEIGGIYNCSQNPILEILKENNIKTRKGGTIPFLISEDKLKNMYIEKEMSECEIASELGMSKKPIHRLLIEYKIPLQPIGFHSQGEKNTAWNGGTSKEPYNLEWNRTSKKILLRDGYTCQNCGEKADPGKGKIVVHHINHIKKDDREINLISICMSCHGIEQGNREYWQPYYEDIMKEKYKKRVYA